MIYRSKSGGVKRCAKMLTTAVLAFVLAIVVFASTAFAGLLNEYNVDIVVDGVTTTVTTREEKPTEILTNANITLESTDKLDLSGFEAGKGGKIVLDRQHTVNVEVNHTITAYAVYADTVGDALTEAGLALHSADKVNYALTDLVTDGMVIRVNTAFTVTLTADGKTQSFAMVEGTVGDLLDLAKVQLGTNDYAEPSAATSLKAGMKIHVYRVSYKTVTETETLSYKTETKTDSKLTVGKTKVEQQGQNGSADVTYKVKLVNGKEKTRTEEKRVVTKKPVKKIVRTGTKAAGVKANGVKSRGGYSVGQSIRGRYTHYCACAVCNGNSRGITTSGRRIYNGMSNPHYVACNWLPLGSVISVNGTNYTVVDRGGSGLSSQGRIDIFTPEGHAACYRYGTGSCSIKIVRLGW